MNEPGASQTHGFLFADLRGYTQFAETRGDQAAAELLARYRLLVREVIVPFHGAEIRTEGDSFYVVFPSASAAVNGGMAILEAASAASGEPGSDAIRVGIGVHAGETAESTEGFVGSAVNIAARICALAGPGELMVSDTVRALTRTFLGLQFVPRGRRRLKGISEPILIYQVLPSTAAAALPARARGPLRSPRMLVAVAIGLAIPLLAATALLAALTGIGPLGRLEAPSPAATSPDAPASILEDSSASADPNPALTADENRLLAKLPAAIGDDCAPASAAEGSAGGSVSLHCVLPLSAAADEVWVDEFPSAETLDGAFLDAVTRTGAPPGDCETTSLAHGPWQVPNVHAGSLLCYQEDGAAWVVWTYEDDRILIIARRGDDDGQALHSWWRETAIFLR
jgi:class 3 adenylate cyclase